MKEVSFGAGLVGYLFEPAIDEGKRPALLCLHGWTSKQDRYFALAELAAEQGYVCLTMDMRGHGRSEGNIEEITRKEFLEDVIAGYDLLANIPNVDTEKIYVTGSSFGGYMTALLCAERPCAGIVLRAPADYPDEGFTESQYKKANDFYEQVKEEKRIWRSTVHPYTETAALRGVHAFGNPVMIIESEKDEIVPQQVLQGYKEAAQDPAKLTYVVMKGAPHGFSKDAVRMSEYADLTLSWIKKQLS